MLLTRRDDAGLAVVLVHRGWWNSAIRAGPAAAAVRALEPARHVGAWRPGRVKSFIRELARRDTLTWMTRRDWISAALAARTAMARPAGTLIDTHIHLFAADQARFPYHRNAVYRPPAQDLTDYSAFVKKARIDHAIIVHSEPYQDDHRYLEYCFRNEPSPGFFKGTCLFDPVSTRTPARMKELMGRNPNRIVALRIHETQAGGKPPTTSGAIRDRDMDAMKSVWAAAGKLGLAIQMHLIPFYAPRVGRLAEQFDEVTVILDHLARAGQGTPAEYDRVLALARLPRVVMKFSGVNYSSPQGYPYSDVKPLVRRTFDAFGPDRMIWGGLGMTMADFEKNVAMFEQMFDFTTEENRARIRGENARRLFGFR
jgi:predicted TIM-barrel fold metal-dependent hydrolase